MGPRPYDRSFVITSKGMRMVFFDVTSFLLSQHRESFLVPRRCYDMSLSGSRRIFLKEARCYDLGLSYDQG